jgi:hypothetical protein
MKMDKWRFLFSALLLIFVLIIISASFRYETKARLVPLIAGIVTLILLLSVLVNEIYPIPFIEKLNIDMTKELRTPDSSFQTKETIPSKKLVAIMSWIIGFFLFIFVFGFHFSIALFTFAFLKIRGKTSWTKALLMAGIVWGAVFMIFELAMSFSLFKGWLFGEIIPKI